MADLACSCAVLYVRASCDMLRGFADLLQIQPCSLVHLPESKEHVMCTEAMQERQQSVVTSLLAIWRRQAASQRMALPLLRTADLLFAQGRLDELPGPFVGEHNS